MWLLISSLIFAFFAKLYSLTYSPFKTKHIKEVCFFLPFMMLRKWVIVSLNYSRDFSINCTARSSGSSYLKLCLSPNRSHHISYVEALVCRGSTVCIKCVCILNPTFFMLIAKECKVMSDTKVVIEPVSTPAVNIH